MITIDKLVKENVLPNFENFRYHKRIMFKYPLHDILCGFYFEKIKDHTYLWLFFQPLFIPNKNIVFTFGERLKNSQGKQAFSLSRQNLNQTVLELILSINSKIDIINTLSDIHSFYNYFVQKETNFNMYRDLTFVNCFKNELDCQKRLTTLISEIEKSMDQHIVWVQELSNSAKSLLNKTKDEKIAIFNSWKEFTLLELGLNIEAGRDF